MNLPNKLTTFRIILIPIFILLLSIPIHWIKIFNHPLSWLIAAFIFAIATLTDVADGRIARSKHLITNFGKFADPMADKMIVMTAFIYLTSFHIIPAWATSIIVIRELAVTGLRILIVEQNGTIMAAKLPGKIKTVTQMLAIIFLLCSNFSIPFVPVDQIIFYIAVIFTIYSGIEYFISYKNVFAGEI